MALTELRRLQAANWKAVRAERDSHGQPVVSEIRDSQPKRAAKAGAR